MNKLGFYIENTTVPFLREAIREVKPPTILIHAGDRGLLRDIRRELSPDSFVIGRMFIPLSEQENWLNDQDPGARGRGLADSILSYDMGLATERGANGRLLIDAWMVLNEALRGPASFADGHLDAETLRRAEALDRLQVAFRERLAQSGLEAVAFNFGAGNYTQAAHYLTLFPRTLGSYTYLGFHEYGWPTLMPRSGSATAALLYRRCMEGIRERFGGRHRVIVTEAGLARMYKYGQDPAGDVGWLYPGEPVPEEQYWESLRWYNSELLRDKYALGACLFSAGYSGRWETFRLLGNDNHGRPILLMSRLATLGAAALPTPESPAPAPLPPKPPAPLPPDPTFQPRLAAVEQYLKLTIEQTTRLENLHTEMAAVLNGLQKAADRSPDALELEILLQQVGYLEDALRRYSQGSTSIAYPPNVAMLKWRVSRLRQSADALKQDAGAIEHLLAEVTATSAEFDKLTTAYGVIPALKQRAQSMLGEVQPLKAKLGSTRRAQRELPPFTDIRAQPPGSAKTHYPACDEAGIRWIVVHHSRTAAGSDIVGLARTAIRKGLPGIPYHFYIAASGDCYQVQPLTSCIDHIGLADPDAHSIAVALEGQFDEAIPTDGQIDALSELARWLMSRYGLGSHALLGAAEIGFPGTSPGIQWLQGYQYKLDVLARLTE